MGIASYFVATDEYHVSITCWHNDDIVSPIRSDDEAIETFTSMDRRVQFSGMERIVVPQPNYRGYILLVMYLLALDNFNKIFRSSVEGENPV